MMHSSMRVNGVGQRDSCMSASSISIEFIKKRRTALEITEVMDNRYILVTL